MYNLVYGILSDSADAADVTQEVFLRAFRGIRGFRQGSSLKTWLYRISVRQALNHRRWCWRHHRQQVSIDAEVEGKNPALDLKDLEATPLEQVEAAEMQAVGPAGARASAGRVSQRSYFEGSRRTVLRRGGGSARKFRLAPVKSRILRGRRDSSGDSRSCASRSSKAAESDETDTVSASTRHELCGERPSNVRLIPVTSIGLNNCRRNL